MSAGSGKVALVPATAALSDACPDAEALVDFVGYGSANCYEGEGPAPRANNRRAVVRVEEPPVDTDDNRADFVSAAPDPR